MEKQSIFKSIRTMISNIEKSIQSWRDSAAAMGIAIEKGVTEALIENVVNGFVARIQDLVSQRGEKTYVFPCENAEEYSPLIGDKRRFVDD
jgi:LPS sulfotransferase NodH